MIWTTYLRETIINTEWIHVFYNLDTRLIRANLNNKLIIFCAYKLIYFYTNRALKIYFYNRIKYYNNKNLKINIKFVYFKSFKLFVILNRSLFWDLLRTIYIKLHCIICIIVNTILVLSFTIIKIKMFWNIFNTVRMDKTSFI